MRTLLLPAEMAEADAYTIAMVGVPGLTLMERAALACCTVAEEMLADTSDHQPQRIAVFVGCGNNGGDGLAIARILLERGYEVDTFLTMPHQPLKGDAAHNLQRLQATNAHIRSSDVADLGGVGYALLVDALFGTGLNRGLSGPICDWVRLMNGSGTPILAVDLPSGLAGGEGKLIGEAVQATRTVAFQYLKLAHRVSPACSFCGQVTVADIGIQKPKGMSYRHFLVEESDYKRPAREQVSHKGSFGSLAILGGFSGMEGAANLAAVSALRFGAGKVRIYTNNRNRFHHDSVMVSHINHFQNNYPTLVIGPGLSRSEEASAQIKRLTLENERVVWDADGLHLLKEMPSHGLGQEWVMTPHPGEAAELLSCLAREIQQDRLWAIDALAKAYPGGWILLKGYRTLVLAPSGELYVIGPGSPALAVAGSGDVLSGMIGAMLAQGFPMRDAVLLAALRHGMAGDYWALHHPDYSMLAEDIIRDLTRRV